MKKAFFSLVTASLLMACGADPAGRENTSQEKKAQATEVSGQAIYEANCVACHGVDGTAGIANAANLQSIATDTLVMKNSILLGKGAMPPFQGRLSQQEIDKVMAYILTLKK